MSAATFRRLQVDVRETEANGGGCRLADRFESEFGDGVAHVGDGEYDDDNAFNRTAVMAASYETPSIPRQPTTE
jgi:hypothetical protein